MYFLFAVLETFIMNNKLLKIMCEFNTENLLALPPTYDQNLCITDTFVAAQGKAKAKEALSTTNTHLVAYCRGRGCVGPLRHR